MPRDALESPLEYTKNRDVHAAGVILLQMLLGLNVVDRFPDFHLAFKNCEYQPFTRGWSCLSSIFFLHFFLPASISHVMQQHALAMLAPAKKNVSPHSLLASMAGLAFGNAIRSPTIAISGAWFTCHRRRRDSAPHFYFISVVQGTDMGQRHRL